MNDSTQYNREVAYNALEKNYENVMQTVDDSGDIEESYNKFLETVDLAYELLLPSEHSYIREIEAQLDKDLKERGVSVKKEASSSTSTSEPTTNRNTSIFILCFLLLFPVVIYLCYRFKDKFENK